VFGNRVLRKIFGPKKDGVTGGWRKLHNEELRNLYSSPSIIRIIINNKMDLLDIGLGVVDWVGLSQDRYR
jgi:hypothetical protein